MARELAHGAWWPRIWSSLAVAGLSMTALVLACAGYVSAQGCPCPKQTMEQMVAQANLIFVGKVIAATTTGGPQMGMTSGQWREEPGASTVHQITMQVETTLKGSTAKITTISMPDACGYPLTVGDTHLVFATRNATGIWTDACKGNASGQAISARAGEVRRVLTAPAAK